MRLLRFMHEEMTKPASNTEATKEQPTPEATIEHDKNDEKESKKTYPITSPNGI